MNAIDVVDVLFLIRYLVRVFGTVLTCVEVTVSDDVTVDARLIDTDTLVKVIDLVRVCLFILKSVIVVECL